MDVVLCDGDVLPGAGAAGKLPGKIDHSLSIECNPGHVTLPPECDDGGSCRRSYEAD